MTHYHIIATTTGVSPISTLSHEFYEDAIDLFTRLTNQFFSGIVPRENLSIENAKAATADGAGAYIGDDTFALSFLHCEETACYSYTWN